MFTRLMKTRYNICDVFLKQCLSNLFILISPSFLSFLLLSLMNVKEKSLNKIDFEM